MSRIIFINRFFHPDHSATSQILSDLAFDLTTSGQIVHVITSQELYEDPAARLPPSEIIGKLYIHRVSTTKFGRSSLFGRSLDYLSFYWSTWRCVVSLAEPGDILVAKTDPPLLSVLAAYVTKKRSMHLVNWLQDLYPEIAVELGVPFIRGPIARAMVVLRNRSLRLADVNVVVSNSMASRVRKCEVAEDRIHVIPNWTNDEEIVPVSHADNPLRRQWQLDDKFVVGYSGNLGRAHEYDTLLGAAHQLRDNSRIVFVFIGGGRRFDELAQRVKEHKLDRTFRFLPYQDREQLKYSLSVPDIHWVSMKPNLEGLLFPSKFYGIAAAGRPVIAITAQDSEIAKLVRGFECGHVIEPGDATGLASAISHLANNIPTVNQMGIQARAMLNANFKRQQALTSWRQLLAALEPGSGIGRPRIAK